MQNTDRPNILWIMGDQMRAQAIAAAGEDPNIRTPNIDRLTGEGVTFSNAIAGCPWCTPFRGAMLTSRYVHECVQRTPSRVDPALPTVADAFNDAGYHTAFFGKWHVDGSNDPAHRVPKERRGRFAHWCGFENMNQHFRITVHGHDTAGTEFERRLQGYENDVLTDELISHLDERREQSAPLFGILSLTPPHDPYTAPASYMQRYNPADLQLRPNVPDIPRIRERARRELAGYYAAIENLDHNVGRLLDALESRGLSENTYLMIFSDHGDMHGSHGYFLKSSPWEEALRIPCVVAGGPLYPRNARFSDAPMNHVDLAPTSLGLAGVSPPDWMRGSDFSAHVLRHVDGSTPDPEEPQSAYIQQCVDKRFGNCMGGTWRGVRTRDGWKYVCREHAPVLMTNLNEDPYEQVNLAFMPEYREKRAELLEELQGWIQRTGDTFALPEA